MRCFNLHLPLVLLAVAALLATATFGCAPAVPASPAAPATPQAPITPPAPTAPSTPPPTQPTPLPSNVPLPVVNYFTSTSDNLPPNALAILLWGVNGADSVSIDNGIGRVEAQGRQTILPAATTTFVLTATNRAGSVTAQVTVEVSQLLSASPHYRPGYSMKSVQNTALVGSPYAIKQDTMTSKGYRWVVDYYDPAFLSYEGSNYTEMNPLTRGVDGQWQFNFKPIRSGDTRVVVSEINDATPTRFDSIIYNLRIHVH